MKDVKKRDIQKYIRLLKNISIEANKTLLRAWALEHLDNLDLRLTNLELTIEGYAHIIRIYSDWICAEHTPDEAEVKIAETIHGVSNDVHPLFQQLECVKKERETYLSNPFWKEIGGAPKKVKRECLLKPETVKMFFPALSTNDHPTRSFISRFNLRHH